MVKYYVVESTGFNGQVKHEMFDSLESAKRLLSYIVENSVDVEFVRVYEVEENKTTICSYRTNK